jgi:hypothetical protein
MEDARLAYERSGPKRELTPYSVLVGYLGTRRLRRDQDARAVLDEGSKLDPSVWPVSIMRCYRGEPLEYELIAAANINDKQIEAVASLATSACLPATRLQPVSISPGFASMGIRPSSNTLWLLPS